MAEESRADRPPAVAIVGMAARFPGAPDLGAFFENLCAGVQSSSRFAPEDLESAGYPPELARDPGFVPVRATIAGAECFDATLFGTSPREAMITDPQHRVFLECCFSALEDAACDPARFDGDIGVFGGCAANTYLLNNLLPDPGVLESMGGLQAILANDKDHLTTRVSYKLGLTGPSVDVQTACSTSLVAVQMACQALLTYQCDAALAGAVSIAVPLAGGHRFQPGDIGSRDGCCRPFDRDASGTFSGDGVGVVVLRRLDDAIRDGDPIRAVILGAAINNDGARKVGYAAPSVDGQAAVIATALDMAEVSARTISYVEAHGTGTALGDPVEVAALTEAFARHTRANGFCALGSVKGNIGHTNTAAGIAGLCKAVLALESEEIPPTLHFSAPNREIDFGRTPFFVHAELLPWPREDAPRRAGVSSFGAGGTNAHVVLEEAPDRPAPRAAGGDALRTIRLSARTRWSLDAGAERLCAALGNRSDIQLADVERTLLEGRRPFEHRLACVASTLGDAREALTGRCPHRTVAGHAPPGGRRVAFLFPGQGFQRVGMGRALYALEPVFRAEVDRCAEILRPMLGLDIRTLLYPAGGDGERDAGPQMDDQLLAGPALFSVCWAAAQLWISRGVRPDVVLGQSTGEYVAAAVAGVMELSGALRLFVARARLLDRAPPGGMLHVALDPAHVEAYLGGGIWLALHNGPEACVLSGEPAAIEQLGTRLAAERVEHRHVRVSVPAHCPLLEPIAPALAAVARTVSLRPPRIPLVSGVTGAVLGDAEATDPDHFVRHLLGRVRHAEAMAELGRGKEALIFEAGPHRSVSALAACNLPGTPCVATLPPCEAPAGAPPVDARLFVALGRAACWVNGVDLPAEGSPEGRRISLPGYAFERQRHWFEPGARRGPMRGSLAVQERAASMAVGTGDEAVAGPSTTEGGRGAPRPELPTPYRAPEGGTQSALSRICADLLGIERVGVDDDFFALGADSLITLRLLARVKRELGVDLPPGAAYAGMTVGHLAAHVDGARGAPDPGRPAAACIVPLGRLGSSPPLFFVHPATGVVFPYFRLGRELQPDVPFYALQAAGLSGAEAPDRTVREMAARYVAAIREVRPDGPFDLGGFSFGCYVAYEMAFQLERQGLRVGHLLMIDESAPLPGHRAGYRMMARIVLGQAGRTFLHHLHDYLFLLSRGTGDAGGLLSSLLRRGSRQVRPLLERSAMAALLPEEAHDVALHQSAMGPLYQLLKIHLRETLEYAPPGRIEAPVTLFVSDWVANRPLWVGQDPDPAMGWGKLAARVDVVRIAGDHLSTIRDPHVAGLAMQIRERLGARSAGV